MRILVVEDEPVVSAAVEALGQAGYLVDSAADGGRAHYLGEVETYDLVVLDLGLPVMDGLTVLKKWRAAGLGMPVLILTARDNWHEKVAGIDAGADDYRGELLASCAPCSGARAPTAARNGAAARSCWTRARPASCGRPGAVADQP